MRRQGNIRLVVSFLIAIAMALILPGLSIAGSLEPPPHAVDGSGNPIPTTHPKFACRGAFMDNADGTVTDCKTGMIWMKNARCFDPKRWSDALAVCSALASGSCDLNDGSSAGDWRLPTIEELKTLPDRAYFSPTLSNAKGDGQWIEGDAFAGVQSPTGYWSATTRAADVSTAWGVWLFDGSVYWGWKLNYYNVWCVRGGN